MSVSRTVEPADTVGRLRRDTGAPPAGTAGAAGEPPPAVDVWGEPVVIPPYRVLLRGRRRSRCFDRP